jgi:cytochrome c peroxidase
MKQRWLVFAALVPTFWGCKSLDSSEDGRAVPDFGAQARVSAHAKHDPLDGFRPALPAHFDSAAHPSSDARVELGKMLYFEARLSKNHDVSCNSCHNVETFGVDNHPTSTGHKKQLGGRNSPTVYNAAGHFVQFWDGRAKDVEAQATGPILNPVEMATSSAEQVTLVLSSMPEYVAAFQRAFPGESEPLITLERVGVAIGAFERGLVTKGRWDKFLEGDAKALTKEEQAGLDKFMDVGCPTCHTGTLLGGESFQKVGLAEAWPNQKDPGRFEVTKLDADRMVFKVPSLRNIAKTAPYFHDGSVSSLEEAVTMMAKYQLGRTLSPSESSSIVAFLNALTGELPQGKIGKPTLPKSTPKTPKADPK